MRVVIKGNVFEASFAAAKRGIPLTPVTEHRMGQSYFDTVAIVPDAFWNAVAEWFCSDGSVAPYPVGACLHYGREY